MILNRFVTSVAFYTADTHIISNISINNQLSAINYRHHWYGGRTL